MKIIFLDFDGVLNDSEYRADVENYYNNPIDESKMVFLKKITDRTGAKIVLSTTWRVYWDKNDGFIKAADSINTLFEKYGLEIYSKTPDADDNRNLEVFMWLCQNDVEQYVILDDIDFFSDENKRHFVQTDDSCGLNEYTADLAIKTLELMEN